MINSISRQDLNALESLHAREALEKDTEFYSELDEYNLIYGVFGNITDFCYASYADMEEAKAKASEMNAAKKTA